MYNEKKTTLQIQMENLDHAMFHIMRLFILPDLSDRISAYVKIAEIHRCEGIACSAFWLDMIDADEYRTICKLFRELIWRIQEEDD